jgi:phosphatidylcholine synthase
VTSRRAAAVLVHVFTASGAVVAALALLAALEFRLRAAFAWLALQVVIDSVDGFLARKLDVGRQWPSIDGARLDDIVDYLAYVFVPALIVKTSGLVTGPLGWVVAAAMLVFSAMGFARVDAKTSDHFFTGFPSYWNIVVLYLVAFQLGVMVNAAILMTLALLVGVPIRYVYPSRTPVLPRVTLGLALVWGVLIVVIIATLPQVSPVVLYGSLVFPVYYVALSLVLDRRRRPAPEPRVA